MGTASAEPVRASAAAPLSLPKTPNNSRAIRQMQKEALAEFNVVEHPTLRLLIEKLGNAAMGGLAQGFLGHARAMQLEDIIKAKADALKQSQKRTRLTTARAITGGELLAKMRQLSLNPATPTKQLKSHKGPAKRVTFSKGKQPQRGKGRAIDIHSSGLLIPSAPDTEDTSSDIDSASEGSTIFLSTPGQILAPYRHHTTDSSAAPVLQASQAAQSTQRSHGRALRPRR